MADKSLRDQVIADAQSLPDLINRASVLDPALARQLTGAAQQSSKTPIGAAVAAVVAWLAAKEGFGWSPEFCDLLAGAAVIVGGYVTHWWQTRNAGLMSASAAANHMEQ